MIMFVGCNTFLTQVLKAILRDVMGEEKLFTFHFILSYIYVMTLVVTVL